MIRARTPEALKDLDCPLEECIGACFPRSHALLEAARHSLFYSLPVAFDPAEGTGCYLATVDRDERDEPWRFLDMGAQIATRAFGENDPELTEAILADPGRGESLRSQRISDQSCRSGSRRPSIAWHPRGRRDISS
jgi:hypothetical protein